MKNQLAEQDIREQIAKIAKVMVDGSCLEPDLKKCPEPYASLPDSECCGYCGADQILSLIDKICTDEKERLACSVHSAAVALCEAKCQARIEALINLIGDLTDADDCVLDHHGDCQAHGYTKPCPMPEAYRVYKEY